MKVVWSEPAEFDLDDLYDFIAKDSPIYAERFIDRIIEALAKLADLPRIGRQVPEANSEHIRELIVQSQRIMYAIDDEQQIINILALVHVRQNLDSQESLPWSKH